MSAHPVADWSEVKTTAIATGDLKRTAELHGIKHAAVRQRAKREGWPVGRRVHLQAAQAKATSHAAIVQAQASRGIVTAVTSAAEAMQNEVASHRDRGTLSAARATAATLQAVEGGVPLQEAPALLAAVKAHRSAHGLDRQDSASQAPSIAIQVNIG